MATSKEFIDYVMEQLSAFDSASCRAMMGEYVLYCRDRVIGGVYDSRVMIKATDSALRLLPDSPLEFPYEGAGKKLLVVENLDDREFLASLFEAVYPELPVKKPAKRKN